MQTLSLNSHGLFDKGKKRIRIARFFNDWQPFFSAELQLWKQLNSRHENISPLHLLYSDVINPLMPQLTDWAAGP